MGRYIEKIFINGCSHTEKVTSGTTDTECGKYSNVDDRGFISKNDWIEYSNSIGKQYQFKDSYFNSTGSVLDKYNSIFKLNYSLLIDWAQHFYFYNKLVLQQDTVSYSNHKFQKNQYPSIYQKNYVVLDKIKDTPYILNFGKSGKGNDYMFMETISTIEQLKDKNEKPELAIIQLSGLNRRMGIKPSDKNIDDLYNVDGSHIFFATPWDVTDFKELAPPPLGEMTTLFNIYALQEYFKSNSIKYLFLNYFPLTDIIKNQFIYNKINKEHFITFDDSDDISEGWIDKMKSKEGIRFVRDLQGHPSTTGYLYMFHRILCKLNKLYDMNYQVIPSYNQIFLKSNKNLL